MKVGVSLSILAQAGRSDVAVYKEHLELGDLAEPLGFDSIFALEHHFTGYSMSPAPAQLLSYFAGRTKRVQLGTAVIVLRLKLCDTQSTPRRLTEDRARKARPKAVAAPGKVVTLGHRVE